MRDWIRGFALWLVTGFRAAPRLATAALLLSAVMALMAPLETYAVKLVVDGVTQQDRGPLVAAGVILISTIFFNFVVGSFEGPIWGTTIDRVHGYLHGDLIRLTTSIPSIVHHEKPDIADRIELLHKRSRQMSFNVMQMLWTFVSVVSAAAVVTLLASVHPILLILPLVGVVRVWTSFVDSHLRFKAMEQSTKYARLADRLSDVTKSPQNAVEIRVFGLRSVLLDRIDALLHRVERDRLRAGRKGVTYELIARVIFGTAYAAAIVFVADGARDGRFSPGDVALVVLLGSRIEQTAGMLANATRSTGETVRMFVRYAWLRRYAREAAWADSTGTAPDRLRQGIELRNVEFRYPAAEEAVLHGVDLSLPAGTTIALVGENGAGKSTLVKLLARLYDPTEGVVLVDGVDLREIDPNAWRERSSAGFQDFVKYEFTAGHTVGIGQLDDMDDIEVVRPALARGDATTVVDRLPNGLETQLGKRFGEGVELSGGQWQRLALARGFMRTEPLLLMLDEPTAALDPEAEHALFDRFATASKETARRTGGITVLVSHRFSTVRMADLIVVLHDGTIDQVGTHEELIAAGGRYAELFELQARAYR